MAFHNVRLPDDLQYRSVFGFGFATIARETASGHGFYSARRAQVKHRYRPAKELQSTEEIAELKEFVLARRGSLHSFRIKDEWDFTTNADGRTAPDGSDQNIGTGDGTQTTFQILKVYDEDGPEPYVRTLTLPVAGTVLVKVDGMLTTSFTVGALGTIVFTTAPTLASVISCGCEFDVHVRFGKGVDEFASATASAHDTWSMENMECSEELDAQEWPELWYPGGCTLHAADALDKSIDAAGGRLQVFQQTGSCNAFLPAPDEFPGGPELFVILVLPTATGTLQLRDDTGATVGSALSAGTTKRLALIVAGGTATWMPY